MPKYQTDDYSLLHPKKKIVYEFKPALNRTYFQTHTQTHNRTSRRQSQPQVFTHKHIHTNYQYIYQWHIQMWEKERVNRKNNPICIEYELMPSHTHDLNEEEREEKKRTTGSIFMYTNVYMHKYTKCLQVKN